MSNVTPAPAPPGGKLVVRLWNEWQITTAVLVSLCLQLLLLFTAGLRRQNPPGWWRKKYFWALYIGSPWIANLSLGILSRASTGDANADVQAFWAAVLLFHLAGVDDFTALSLEDNKLWDRRCFTLAVQAATTVYVFFRYFQDGGFQRLIGPFWLILVAGLMKCVEQVLALWRGTMEELIKSVLGTPDPGPDYADTMDRVDGALRSGVLRSLNIDNERVDDENSDDLPVEDAVEEYNAQDQDQAADIIRLAHFLFSRFKVLFADGIFSFKDRQDSRLVFLNKGLDWAFKVVEMELSFVYDRLYTKASVSRTVPGVLIRVASLLLTLAGSLWALFATTPMHGSGYRLRNRVATIILLVGAVATDAIILVRHICSIWSVVHSDRLKWLAVKLVNERRWSERMAQCNLVTFCLQKLPWDVVTHAAGQVKAQKKRHDSFCAACFAVLKASVGFLYSTGPLLEQMKGVLVFHCSSWLLPNQSRTPRKPGTFWAECTDTKLVSVRAELKSFVFQELRTKERLHIQLERERGRGNYRGGGVPEDDRGLQALKNEKVTGLEWSLQDKEFDESLLIWHIATDLCFRKQNNLYGDPEAYMAMAQELSNYLFYIMVVHPLMLSPSTTMAAKRCRDTCAEVRRHFFKEHLLHRADASSGGVHEESAHELLLNVETPLRASVVKGDKSKSVLWDGCFLAKELTRAMSGDPGRMWRVVCKVWVEMLCYAAINCGGYQHAERIKEGGELLTFVCLLMTHLGMSKHYRTQVGDAYAHLSAYTA